MTILSKILALAGGAIGGPMGYKLVDKVVDYMQDDSHGGVTGLFESFKSSGLGNIVSSWVGTGPNLPISAQEIERAFGHDKLEEMGKSMGIPTNEVAAALAKVFPQLVDKITPDGKMPADPIQALKDLAQKD